MKNATLLPLFLATCLGCSRPHSGEAPPLGQVSKPGSSLAYEHTVRVQLAGELIAERVAQVRAACQDERFGMCSVLAVEVKQSTEPSGQVVVRAVAAAIDPLVAAAAQGGEVESATTHAEDLAAAIADTAREHETLTRQRESLLAIQGRVDLTATDLLAIVRALSEIEVNLAATETKAATHQRRVETNLLSLHFQTESGHGSPGSVKAWLVEIWRSFRDGAGMAIRLAAYTIPFLALTLILMPILRRAWKWAKGPD